MKLTLQTDIDRVIQGLLESREGLISWLSQERQKLVEENGGSDLFEYGLFTPELTPLNNKLSRYLTRLAHGGTYAACCMIKTRLLSPLAPFCSYTLEREC